MSPIFAKQTVLYNGFEYQPGQELKGAKPEDVEDAIDADLVESASSPSIDTEAFEQATDAPDNTAGDAAPDYSKEDKATLEAITAERGIDVQGTGKNGSVTKQDLVAALEQDDERNS